MVFPDPGGLRTPLIEYLFMLATMLSVWCSIGNQPLCPVPGNPESSRKCAFSEGTCSRHRSSIARVVRMPRFRYLNCTLALSQESDGLYLCCSCTSLCSFCFSVISALFPLLSLPLTSQIALGMYLLLHEWGRELPFLTITLSTSFSSKIVLQLATASVDG